MRNVNNDVIINYFLRVVKNHNHYAVFKKAFRRGREHQFTSLTQFRDRFKSLVDRDFESHARDRSDYEYITMGINILLKLFLENGGVDPRRLGMYGQEIFDLVCYRLYGDKYLDEMDAMNQGAPRPTNDREMFLVSEYMQRINNGERITYDDVVRAHAHDDMSMWDMNNYRDAENYHDNGERPTLPWDDYADVDEDADFWEDDDE